MMEFRPARSSTVTGTLSGLFVVASMIVPLMLPGERPKGLTIGPMLVVVVAAASWAFGSYYPRRWPLPRASRHR